MKRLLVIFFICMFLLSGCHPMTEEEKIEYERQLREEIANQPRHEYERVTAIITELDMKNWFVKTQRYEWSISVYYEPYDLCYDDYGYSTGMFGAPSFFGKTVGDNVEVEICNTYIKENLVERKITEIIE